MKVFKGIHLQKHLQNGNQEIMKVTKTQNLSSKKWSRRRDSNPSVAFQFICNKAGRRETGVFYFCGWPSPRLRFR